MAEQVTISEDRHNLARDANHEATAIIDLMKEKLSDFDTSPDTFYLLRGLVHRLWTLNDVMYETVIDDPEIATDELAKQLGATVWPAPQ